MTLARFTAALQRRAGAALALLPQATALLTTVLEVVPPAVPLPADAVLRLAEGGCDLLMAYHHASHPLPLSPERYQMLNLGQETLIACSRPDASGAPLFRLPAPAGRRQTRPRRSAPPPRRRTDS
jgi:hypothetical protein